jgi:hypothetical protein
MTTAKWRHAEFAYICDALDGATARIEKPVVVRPPRGFRALNAPNRAKREIVDIFLGATETKAGASLFQAIGRREQRALDKGGVSLSIGSSRRQRPSLIAAQQA